MEIGRYIDIESSGYGQFVWLKIKISKDEEEIKKLLTIPTALSLAEVLIKECRKEFKIFKQEFNYASKTIIKLDEKLEKLEEKEIKRVRAKNV